MKFSHTLSLNSNPDWVDHYIDYAGLKKDISDIRERSDHPRQKDVGGYEESIADEARDEFLSKLTSMASGVRQFYDQKKADLDTELARIQPLLERSSSRASLVSLASLDEKTPLTRSMKSTSSLASGLNLEDQRRTICDMFTQYHGLKQFAELNCTAVQKILKKYDKTMLDNLKVTHLDSFKLLLPFWDHKTPDVDRSLQTLQSYFAHFFCQDNQHEALRQLKLMVREVITYQRHSVWLDVIQNQRQLASATVSERTTSRVNSGTRANAQCIDLAGLSPNTLIACASICIFVSILSLPMAIFHGDPTKQNALALFVFVSILWATEALPLFVTSMLVPLLSVILRVIVLDEVRLDAVAASRHVFGTMFSHVIMLLLGGFSIAAALSKHNIAQRLAASISHRCGSGIRTVLLVNMFIATGASMWISNVAAPVLTYSLLSPILKASTAASSRAAFGTLQQKQADYEHRLSRALVMGVALASNVGGMASPISSPQNLFAIEYTPIGWMAWFTVSIPLCVTLNLLIWTWLIICFRLPKAESSSVQYALQRDQSTEPFTSKQCMVITISVVTVLLWCASVNLSQYVGQMGVLGIIPFVAFFGSGLLTTQDLNNFLWSVVVLAMGGLTLGEVIKTSGLLDMIASNVATFIAERAVGTWLVLCTFSALILFCTTFVSHTVGAIVVIPIVQAVGSQMEPIPRDRELVFAAALVCSAAMGLPVSGFPNMTAIAMEDPLGNRYLTTGDFLKYALPASVMSLVVIVTLGYWLIGLAVDID